MDPSHVFESLAGVRPGRSTVGEVASRFGPPAASEASDGGLFLSFEGRGVHLIVYRDQRGADDPVVAEVRLTPPSAHELPCGVRVGQLQAEALCAVRRSYRITDEYEDAVYFRPSARDDLLASVEFLDAGVVVSVELMHHPCDSRP
jgi:hypothetical protein